jgi:hypothetical protein
MRARNQQNGSGLLPTPIWNRFQRCRALAPPSEAEIAAMVSDFLSRGGTVNRVPTAYAVPTMAAPLSASAVAPVPEAPACADPRLGLPTAIEHCGN